MAAGHPLAARRTARLADFAADPFIVGSATAEDTLMRVSLPPGFRPRVDIVTADWTAKLGCVAAGWAWRSSRRWRPGRFRPASRCCACTPTTRRAGCSATSARRAAKQSGS